MKNRLESILKEAQANIGLKVRLGNRDFWLESAKLNCLWLEMKFGSIAEPMLIATHQKYVGGYNPKTLTDVLDHHKFTLLEHVFNHERDFPVFKNMVAEARGSIGQSVRFADTLYNIEHARFWYETIIITLHHPLRGNRELEIARTHIKEAKAETLEEVLKFYGYELRPPIPVDLQPDSEDVWGFQEEDEEEEEEEEEPVESEEKQDEQVNPEVTSSELDSEKVFDAIESLNLGFHLGVAVIHIADSVTVGKKQAIEDLELAIYHIRRELAKIKKQNA